MSVRIKRIDKDIPMPEYQTDGAAGFDLCSRIDVLIQPKEMFDIPLNVVIEAYPIHVLLLTLRSSTPNKFGITMLHSPGIIDSDYCGDNDEIKLRAYNFTDKPATIPKGIRIAQGIFVVRYRAEWEEVDTMERKDRGGFGSTDYDHASDKKSE